MGTDVLAEVEFRCYLTAVMKGPAAALRRRPEGFWENGEVVAVTGFYVDAIVDDGPLTRLRITAEVAAAIAANDEMFDLIFG